MRKQFQLANRREFLADAARSAVLAATLTAGSTRAGDSAGLSVSGHRLSPQRQTGPALIAYEEIARIRSPHPEPRRLVIGPKDRLYVCAGNWVTGLTSEGQVLREISLSEPARCVAVAADGTLYVGLRDHIEVFDVKGNRVARWESAGRRAWLTGAVTAKDEVIVCDAGQRVVLRYDRMGKLLRRIGAKDPERNIPGFSIPSPYLGVVIGSDGLLHVNNLGRHRVEGYTIDGDLECTWGRPSAAIDGFCGCCNPIGLAVLPDGRFVTCEKGVPRVKVHSPTGEFESVVAGTEAFPENAQACTGINDCVHGGLDVAVDSRGRVYIMDLVTRDIRLMRRKLV